MQHIKFHKFNGAGNDFILVDARHESLDLSAEQIAQLCHRRFGIGADGLMLLLDGGTDYDFRMRYYNSDGCTAEMCGNGGRCIAMFAHLLGAVGSEMRFVADDGPHAAAILGWDGRRGTVRLGMRDVAVDSVRTVLDGHRLNTGVPHYVQRVDDLERLDVAGEGRRLRHHPALGPEGANVNFVQPMPDGTLSVRTYERGVEDETWACGTGVTACALVTGCRQIEARGGRFQVDFVRTADCFAQVFLTGPVALSFTGQVEVEELRS